VIWTLKIQCEWGRYIERECIQVIEIADETTLYDLHLVIQDLVNFENDHLFEFFAGRHHRNRKMTFVDESSWSFDYEKALANYEEIALKDIYPLPKSLQLFYHFDFGDDWYFKIMRTRKKPKAEEKGAEYPNLIESIGQVPQQYPTWDE